MSETIQAEVHRARNAEDAFLRICEVLGLQATRFAYLDAAAIRADRDRLRAALISIVEIWDGDAEPKRFIDRGDKMRDIARGAINNV